MFMFREREGERKKGTSLMSMLIVAQICLNFGILVSKGGQQQLSIYMCALCCLFFRNWLEIVALKYETIRRSEKERTREQFVLTKRKLDRINLSQTTIERERRERSIFLVVCGVSFCFYFIQSCQCLFLIYLFEKQREEERETTRACVCLQFK